MVGRGVVTSNCHTISYYAALGTSVFTFFHQPPQNILPQGPATFTHLPLQLGGLLSLTIGVTGTPLQGPKAGYRDSLSSLFGGHLQ